MQPANANATVSAGPWRRWWCFLAAICFQHVAGGSDSAHQAIVDALTTGMNEARGSLREVRESLRQLRADQHDLIEAHAALQDSYSTLRVDYADLQQRAATLSTPPVADGDNTFASGVGPWSSTEVSPHDLHSERRKLSTNAACDAHGDARLVVEGPGVVMDDVMVGVGDHQSSVMQSVYGAGETAYSIDALRDRLCRPVGSTDVVKAFQTLDATSVYDVEHFRINKTDFVAVANYRNGTDNLVKSPVYRYSAAAASFELFQEFDTAGALDWEHFRIGNADFIAVANFRIDMYTHIINSTIFRYNETTSKFDVFQHIATRGARQWNHFQIGGMHLLAVANFRHNYGNEDAPSAVYRYNNTTTTFELFQDGIGLGGAYDVEHFQIGDADFLAVAYRSNGGDFTIKSVVYQYNATASLFESFQEFDTSGGSDWEYFRVGDGDFIAIANERVNSLRTVISVIYRYNATAASFQVFQEILTESAFQWEHFRIGESDFLACAASSTAYNSVVYRYNVVAQGFEPVQAVEASNARCCTHFRIGDLDFLAFGAHSGAASVMLCNAFCSS